MMLRPLYSLVLYLLAPAVLLRLFWRGLRVPGYRQRLAERFGFAAPATGTAPLWVHAVSVGEAQAAAPLIRELLRRHPGTPVLVTTTTPTGAERVRALFGDRVRHVYAPYDLPDATARFLARQRPRLAIIMETELWPNLFHACKRRGVDVIIANARLSERSAHGYGRLGPLTAATLADVTLIAAQAEADAQRFCVLGADRDRVRVTGNIKFDIRLPPSLHEQGEVLRRVCLGAERPVWIAASTHEGEEAPILAAHAHVRQLMPQALLMLVPRHPERFGRAAALCRQAGFDVVLRSEDRPCNADTAVFVGDSMGELSLFYAAADLAFVGGSLVPVGGHNILEPAALGKPVLFGPHMFNFETIATMFLELGAARQVADASTLARVVVEWLRDANLRDGYGAAGARLVAENRGALERLMGLIQYRGESGELRG